MVYVNDLPGRLVTEAQAVQAKKAVNCCSSLGSLMRLFDSPLFRAGSEK